MINSVCIHIWIFLEKVLIYLQSQATIKSLMNITLTYIFVHYQGNVRSIRNLLRGSPSNCRGDNLAIEFSDEFSTLGIPLGTCRLITDNAMVNSSLAASDKGKKIFLRLNRKRTATKK